MVILLTAFWLQRQSSMTLNPACHSTLITRLKAQSIHAVMGFIIGMTWVVLQTFFTVFMDEAWFNKPVQITGNISNLVLVDQQDDRVKLSFQIKVDEIQLVNDEELNSKGVSNAQKTSKHTEHSWLFSKPKIQLSWYLSPSQFKKLTHIPQTGEVWKLAVKLKANHATMNFGALDYETWLFQNSIAARGYVLNKQQLLGLTERLQPSSGIDLRSKLAKILQDQFSDYELKGLYQALTYGDKSAITDQQWQVLQTTGTIHLMAISGLHMGIIAALGYWVFKGFWWLGLYRLQRFTLPVLGAVGAWLFATVYLILSGYAIPTQRAYLMVMVVLMLLLLRREFQPWSALALAALIVVLWDVRSVLSLGFWLSFLAVALIFATLKINFVKRAAWWQQLLWIQLVLTVGLAPYLIWAFHSLPLFSFISNLLAVPFVSFIGLPLLFILSFVSVFSTALAQWLMPWIDQLWAGLWYMLNFIANLEDSNVTLGQLSGWALVGIYVGLFITLLHNRWQVKGLALLIMAALLIFSLLEKDRPETDQAWLHLLDVGQGQALVIETKNHVLVYDTGAKWGDKMDGAKMAILPFLRAQTWTKIDRLMISHSDIDHAGGLNRLLQNIDVDQISSGQAEVLNNKLNVDHNNLTIQDCTVGQHWQWDGVTFEVFSPGLVSMQGKFKSDNDQSCVLKVTAGQQSVLIPGDLSSKAEQHVIDAYGQQLQSTLLVAGHHGSRYSSSTEWLNTVDPQVVLFTAGYKNRYGFPAEQTLQRLNPNINWYNTACSGGLSFKLGSTDFNALPTYQARKNQQKWYHHRCLDTEKGRLFQ